MFPKTHVRCRGYSATLHLKVLLDGSLESLGVGTDDLGDLLAILEQDKGGHGADAEFLSDIGDLVDVNLVEAGVGVGVGELDDLRCNDLAGTAPGSEAVEDHESALLSDGLVKVGLGLKVVNSFLAHCCGESSCGGV